MKALTLIRKHAGKFLLLSFTISSIAAAETPSYVYIDTIKYAGSGCPAGSVSESISYDLTAFTLLFDSYVAEVGPQVSYRESRKNCNLVIGLEFPQGWSYTIFDVDYRGYVSLDRKIEGLQKSDYHFMGDYRNGVFSGARFRGPVDKDYYFRDSLKISSLVWSPCGASRPLVINTQVRLNNRRNRRGSGVMTVDSIDGQLIHKYGIRWKRCRY